jgi:hypothetical protein
LGNLGLYQDIVTQAARSGGAERCRAAIEKAPVAMAVPRTFAAGGAVWRPGWESSHSQKPAMRTGRREAEAAAARDRLNNIVVPDPAPEPDQPDLSGS